MPRPSSNPDKARQGGGVEPGNYLVSKAEYRNVKTERKPTQTNLVLDCAVLDKDGEPVRGADAVELFFSLGEKSIEAFHPGQCTGPDDADPRSMGTDVDAAGNTLFCVSDGDQINKSCGYMVFLDTMAKAGFPKSIMDRSYAADFVGLKFALNTLASAAINERFQTRLSTRPTSDGGTVTYKVCEKWLNPNYLTAGKNGASAGTDKSAKADKTEKAAKESKTDDTPKASLEDKVREVLGTVARRKAGATVDSLSKLNGFFTNDWTKLGAPWNKQLGAAQEFVKNAAWVEATLDQLGATYDDGTVTFAAASTEE